MDLSDVMLKMDGKMDYLILNSKTWDFQTRIILIQFKHLFKLDPGIQNMELKIKNTNKSKIKV